MDTTAAVSAAAVAAAWTGRHLPAGLWCGGHGGTPSSWLRHASRPTELAAAGTGVAADRRQDWHGTQRGLQP